MIRIPPYPEWVEQEYLYFVASALPFWKNEILPKDKNGNVIQWKEIFGGKQEYRMPQDSKIDRDSVIYKTICTLCSTKKDEESDADLIRLFLKKYVRKLYVFLYVQDNLQEEKLKILLLQPISTIPELDCSADNLLVEEGTINKDECRKVLSFVFSYERLSSHRNLDRLIEHMGVDVCPYCNRFLIRPTRNQRTGQLDHFRDKVNYPQFAVSLRNLVPSCTVCNHKKSKQSKEIFYPYMEEIHPEDQFRTEPIGGFRYLLGEAGSCREFKLTLKQTEKSGMSQQERESYQEKLENTFGLVFDLEELYQQQKEYVLMMFRQNAIWGAPYLESLDEDVRTMFTEEELDGIRYLRSIAPENYIHTPLGRLTHDINEEIKLLKQDAKKKYE